MYSGLSVKWYSQSKNQATPLLHPFYYYIVHYPGFALVWGQGNNSDQL